MSETINELEKLLVELETNFEKNEYEEYEEEYDVELQYSVGGKNTYYTLTKESKTILNRFKNFIKKNKCVSSEEIIGIIDKILEKTIATTEDVENILAKITAIQEDDFEEYVKTEINKEKVLFISHCSKDSFYVEKMIELLQFIGIKDKSQLFCSSKPGYDIPEGEDIYDYLKNLFKEKDIYLVTLLSNNYYNSTACLNEMGAGWLTSCAQTAFLMPGFSFKDIDGAINPRKIMITLTDKARLNDFKDKLINVFGLDSIDQNIWEDQRNKIVEEIEAHYEGIRTLNTVDSLTSIEKRRITPSGNDVDFLLSFRNEGTTEVACIGLDIELKDIYGNSASIFINDSNHSFLGTNLHPDENRFENIKISQDIFDTKGEFNFYKLNKPECKIEALWG
ncbi:MAG: toll/interleukin-1 receptor domain-containing protein [Tissierellales bacterium]|jgi:hypothetical protein|nr:toll/interleukin-1 receptor domain-containing protein [Tissierellales bacterium]